MTNKIRAYPQPPDPRDVLHLIQCTDHRQSGPWKLLAHCPTATGDLAYLASPFPFQAAGTSPLFVPFYPDVIPPGFAGHVISLGVSPPFDGEPLPSKLEVSAYFFDGPHIWTDTKIFSDPDLLRDTWVLEPIDVLGYPTPASLGYLTISALPWDYPHR